jgi:FkbM family methyltransferase
MLSIKTDVQSGMIYCARKGRELQDAQVVDEILRRDDYRLKDFCQGFIDWDVNLVVDIGGHIGCFGWLVKQIYPSTKVIAFEPNIDSYEMYKVCVEKNRLSGVIVCNIAVSYSGEDHTVVMVDSSTAVSLSVSSEDAVKAIAGNFTGVSDRLNLFRNFGGSSNFSVINENVETMTLEEIVTKFGVSQIDILKMDCEGAESELLLHCEKETIEKAKTILCEYHIPGGIERILSETGGKLSNFDLLDREFQKIDTNDSAPIGCFWAIKRRQ